MDARRVIRFVPNFDPDESEKRELFCLPALYSWLYQKDRKKSQDYKVSIRAHLAWFVKGFEVDNIDYMKTWRDDIWELRIQFQNLRRKEATRIFCTFPNPDVLFCTHWKMRSDLGDKDDPLWNVAINKVLTEFEKYFPGDSPVKSRPFSNCVTANYYDHYE